MRPAGGDAPGPAPGRIFIEGAMLLDGVDALASRPHSLLVEEGRIRALAPAAELPCPDDAQVIDATGLTLMPGLIDCHDHMAAIPGSMWDRAQIPQSLAAVRAAITLEDMLLSGFTAVRDAGGLDLGLKLAVEQGLVAGPRVQISVNILSQTGGQNCHIEPGGVDSQYPVLPGVPPSVCDGADACRARTREMIQAGADWIKLATTGGISTPVGGPLVRQFSRDEVAAIVDTAHAAGKPVMCHAYGGEGAKIAIACGVDSIEHGAALDRADLEAMAERGIWLVPTFSVLRRVVDLASGPGSTVPPAVADKARGLLDVQRDTFAAALELGVPIALGTDIGNLRHGHNACEFAYMAEAGMPALRAIRAGTWDAARCMGLENTGRLAVGNAADLLLLDGDPVADVRLLGSRDRIKLVMRGGRLVKCEVERVHAPSIVERERR